MRAATVANSFRYAIAGLRYLLWTQRNAKIHTAIGLAAVALGFVLGIDRYEWLTLMLTTDGDTASTARVTAREYSSNR